MLEKPDKYQIPSPDNLKGFEALNPLQKFSAENLKRILSIALQYGVISEEHIKGKVVDFGCGMGGSAWYLKRLGGDVTALDLEEMTELKRLDVLSEDKIVSGDGTEYLSKLPESSLDLIVTIMFGPDQRGDLARKFLPVAKRAIKQNGAILVFSEVGSLGGFDAVAGQNSVRLDNNSRIVMKADLETTRQDSFNDPTVNFRKDLFTVLPPAKSYDFGKHLESFDMQKFLDELNDKKKRK